jgi:hypothetical protein
VVDQGEQGPNNGMPRYEKQEKGQEKQEEKGKGPDEKYERNPLGFIIFAIDLFWLGVYLLLRNRHVFADTDQSWAYLVWGIAALGAVEIVIRLMVPRWRRAVTGTFVWTVIWAGVGFGLWTNNDNDWEIIGPVVIIAVAVAMVLGRLIPRR